MFQGIIDKKHGFKVLAFQYHGTTITEKRDKATGKWILKSHIDFVGPVRIHYERSSNND